MAGFYLGGKAFSNLFLGSQPVEEVYIGSNLVWMRTVVLPIGPDTMFLGGVASTFDSSILASKLNGDNLTYYRELTGNVYASSSTNYDIDAGAFNTNTNITSYIDGGRCKTISGSAFYGASNLITASFVSASTIGSQAFWNSSNLTTISFPNAVTMSGVSPFYDTKIVDATFPKLVHLVQGAFSNVETLLTASFPLVTNIPQQAFYYCRALATASLPLATTIGNNAFEGCYINLVTASFPLVTTIGNNAFQYCSALRLPPTASTITIGTSSFNECTSLQTANFPKVTTIGPNAFVRNTGLLTASFVSASVIGSSAFFNCTALKVINFPTASTINTGAFYNCSSLVTASFPSASIIGEIVFQGCTSLVSASLPLVKNIPYSTFYNNFNIQYINLPGLSGSTALNGSLAFQGVNSLTGSIIVPVEQLTAGGDRPSTALLAFHSYPNYYDYFAKYWNIQYLTGSSIQINKTGTQYTQGELEAKFKNETTTFFSQASPTTIMSSSTDYHITASAFSGQSTLNAFIDTGKCTVISASAFAFCNNLTTASFANVRTIIDNAFQECTSLKYINLPSLVTMSGQLHFYSNTALQTIDLPEVLNIGAFSFSTVSNMTTIAAPKATSIGEFAFDAAARLGSNGVNISFPSVTTVAQGAFNRCQSLSQISLPALSGSTALGGGTGNNNVFFGLPSFGTITVPSYLSASNGGNPDGDLVSLAARNWYIQYI